MDYWTILLGILYFVVLQQLVYLTLPWVRRNQRNDQKYELRLHYVVIGRQILLFLLPFLVVFYWNQSIAQQYAVGLIALGLSINIFWVVQSPQLTKTNLYVDFSVDCIKNFRPTIKLKPDTEYIIYTRIYNLGFHTLKNVFFLIYFREGFEVISNDDKRYEKIDFTKKFTVQKCNYGAAFSPKDNFLTISPQEWFIFPLIVRTPKTNLDREIEVQIQSENSWGVTKYPIKIETLR